MTLHLPNGERLLRVDEIDSTNLEARRQALGGEEGPLWILAGRQLAGRGRRGRSWASPPGNLHATLLCRCDAPPQRTVQLSFVAALAVWDALVDLASQAPRPTLKWPNDILIDGAKVCGILAETLQGRGASRGVIAIGVGINLSHAPEDTPYPATALARYGAAPTPDEALTRLAGRLSHWRGVWSDGAGFDRIRNVWLDRAHALGERVSVNTGSLCLTGRFVDLAEDGAMVLALPQGERHLVRFGDVSEAASARLDQVGTR